MQGNMHREFSLAANDAVPGNTSLNDMKTPGVYRLWGKYQNAFFDSDTNIYAFMLILGKEDEIATTQIVFGATSLYAYWRSWANNQWYAWRPLFTIPDFFSNAMPANGSVNIAATAGSKLRITVIGGTSSRMAEILVYVASNGNIGIYDIYKGSEISHTQTTNRVTLTNGSSSACTYFVEVLSGSAYVV